GSGRLVGAQLMGEFAWSIENMLNRILDKTIDADEHAFELMEQAIAALPELIAQTRGQGEPATSPLILMAAADALASQGETDTADGLDEKEPATALNEEVTTEYARQLARSLGFLDDEDESVSTSGAEQDIAAGHDVGAQSAESAQQRLDPQLIDIFSNETSAHLAELRELLGQADSTKGAKRRVRISDELLRALHTLTGSASTAGIDAIAEVCGPIERAARTRRQTNKRFTSGQVNVLVDTAAFVERVVEALRDSSLEMPVAGPLREAIRHEFGEVPDFRGPHVDVFPGIEAASGEPANTDEQAVVAETTGEHDEMLRTPGERAGTMAAEDLEQIFLEEAADILVAADNALQQWDVDRADETAVSELQRQLHTLKGGARMAGFTSIGDLSHALESLIIELLESRIEAGTELFESMHKSCDRLNTMLEQALQGELAPPATELIALLDTLRTRGADQLVSENTGQEPPLASVAATVEEPQAPDAGAALQGPPTDQIFMPMLSAEIEADGGASVKAAAQSKPPTQQELVRVRSELLDNLVNYAGEVNIYHARLEQQINSFGFNLTELDQTVFRLGDQLRNLELETEAQILFRYEQEKDSEEADFDPLELDRYSTIQQLSRSLAESVSDLVSIKDMLYDLVRDSETLLLQQSRVSTDLQEGLMRTRMVHFSGLTPRLRRIARQTADELGKRVELEVAGQNSEIDRSVLDRMVAPLEHMLRNAISHGIEPPDERKERGKPEQGKVKISVGREGTEIVVRVEDDGAGIDLERVREKATELGSVDAKGVLSDNDIMQFILEPGFSTAKEVTQIAGRGVGMDVVNSEIKELGGVLRIDSSRGAGTAFTVRLPFTLAINQALLVQTGDDLYAVPLASIEGIVRLTVDELKAKYDQINPRYEYAANEYELKCLGMLLGGEQPLLRDPHAMFPVLLVKSGDRRVALQVDSLLGSREVVVKPVGPQISKVRGISGATILGDGRVVLILDVAGLVRMGAGVETTYQIKTPEAALPGEEARSLTIMVVDDSITIRKVTARMLERNHFSVVTARDGIDAVSQLQDSVPDVMLLDIEMPRMDGYELATHVRSDNRLKSLPIIMITSRTGEKHRRRALDIGVDRYLGKPYQETDLLNNINEVLQSRG
ncbi:MAG: Hpt domain-containing protein, partial [Gammaproteobacteria bacterium]